VKHLTKLINKILFESRNELSQIQELLEPTNLQANLKTLLSKLLFERTTYFRQHILNEESNIILSK
jgi:hypothetical protein